jgi:hypothetical protein
MPFFLLCLNKLICTIFRVNGLLCEQTDVMSHPQVKMRLKKDFIREVKKQHFSFFRIKKQGLHVLYCHLKRAKKVEMENKFPIFRGEIHPSISIFYAPAMPLTTVLSLCDFLMKQETTDFQVGSHIKLIISYFIFYKIEYFLFIFDKPTFLSQK